MTRKADRQIIGKTFFTVVCSLLICADIAAQENYIFRDNENLMSEKEAQNIRRVIDHQVVFFKELFPESDSLFSNVKISLFDKYDEYIKYQLQVGKEVRKNDGFYSVRNKEVVVFRKDKKSDRFLSVCYHELCHYFTHRYIKSPPSWLNEGLATYFEAVKVSSKKISHQENENFKARVKTLLELKNIDLNDFVEWKSQKFYDVSFSNESYGYAVSYCIMSYLLEVHCDTAKQIIREIALKTSPQEAFDRYYAGGFRQFEQDFSAHYSK